MDATLLKELLQQRIVEKGYSVAQSRIVYRDLMIAGKGKKDISAYNQLWMLIDDVPGVRIESSYGEYNLSNFAADEQQHEHTDQISIENLSTKPIQVKMYQIILKK
ncbi:hypothetical protein [Catalinimonas niigatensis]|uniref:hypothetical protein n=1 Tax=Catalinimonas niigatensis TaxID=1397264 RepID=UPI0026661049|nr:hypothetical protein [Catalinimonas niigatensis]WPP49635.1 hypothetical protein PZB72_23455 [Catalinimonas niigatensis]